MQSDLREAVEVQDFRAVLLAEVGRDDRLVLLWNTATNTGVTRAEEEGWHFSCERGCTRDDCGKTGPFSVERLQMDLAFVNVSCVQTSTQRSEHRACRQFLTSSVSSPGPDHSSIRHSCSLLPSPMSLPIVRAILIWSPVIILILTKLACAEPGGVSAVPPHKAHSARAEDSASGARTFALAIVSLVSDRAGSLKLQGSQGKGGVSAAKGSGNIQGKGGVSAAKGSGKAHAVVSREEPNEVPVDELRRQLGCGHLRKPPPRRSSNVSRPRSHNSPRPGGRCAGGRACCESVADGFLAPVHGICLERQTERQRVPASAYRSATHNTHALRVSLWSAPFSRKGPDGLNRKEAPMA